MSDCIEWSGYRNRNGYGQRRIRGKGELGATHRLAWIDAHGPIPDGLCVLHSCDNPACCNVEHLFLGTHAENMADRDRKGRTIRGSAIASAKLIEDQALGVMARILTRRETQTDIAASLGVSISSINDIWMGRSWAHLFGPQ